MEKNAAEEEGTRIQGEIVPEDIDVIDTLHSDNSHGADHTSREDTAGVSFESDTIANEVVMLSNDSVQEGESDDLIPRKKGNPDHWTQNRRKKSRQYRCQWQSICE
ncbi:hypothetical protein DMENIID0001_000800 [Sergentomyia squamirostris]